MKFTKDKINRFVEKYSWISSLALAIAFASNAVVDERAVRVVIYGWLAALLALSAANEFWRGKTWVPPKGGARG